MRPISIDAITIGITTTLHRGSIALKMLQNIRSSTSSLLPLNVMPQQVLEAEQILWPSLEETAAAASRCQKCGLCETRRNVVFSRGSKHSKLMIIGEGPGQREDETGLPFVGAAGQLLDKILAAINLSRDKDVYICNIVKCRPPQNRVPAQLEIEACRPFLEAQIKFVQPKIILLAGTTAVTAMLQIKEPISKLRG
jgi:DNA polymerase